ncbi:MAG: BatA domain-containing protein [Planctomycetota bacterium]
MNFWPSLSSWHFALAGLVAAAGPVIIHLLNRRRFRVVQWAAMDFLREAIQRNRRILQIRDLLLLALRTLAVLLFGLALARPYLAANSQKFDGTQPLHAVLLVDNSLSMGYQTLAGTLLDEAKARAREFIDKLPRGSKITLVPLCGSASNTSVDPYETAASALDALDRIEVVDRATSTRQAVNTAKRACELLPELSKRLVLISDQQRGNWLDWQPDSLADLPALQVVQVKADAWDNSWISDLRVPDGLADTETPTTMVVEVQHRGSQPRRDVQVTLWIDERPIASQTVTLEPAEGARQISFQHVFDTVAPQAGREVFVPIKATLSPDNLAADDERHLLVPVVAALPVVFVDQYGPDEEDPVRRKLGETRHLRTLLAPRTQRDNAAPPLIKVRHVKLGDLNRDLLSDTRLVVIAGVNQPGESVDLLREFVQQGGQLLIAAGGEFDADAWSQAAWRDGRGILPLPLKAAPLGATPDEAGARLQPCQIAFE